MATDQEVAQALGLYPVTLWGIPTGTTDARTQLQSLADTVGKNGGGTIVIPTGVLISVSMAIFSGVAPTGFAASLRLPNNVHLELNGELKLLPNQGATLGKWKNSGSYCILTTKDGAKCRNVRIFGTGIVNGNAINNAAGDFHTDGVRLSRADRCSIEGITVKNIRGTGGSPPNESFACTAYRSTNCYMKDVYVTTDDGGTTSSGFADNYCYGLTYENCVSEDCGSGQAFASHGSGALLFTVCVATQFHSNGFNLEAPCGPVVYNACRAGGQAGPDYKGSSGSAYTAGEDLGGGVASYHAGFQLNCDNKTFGDTTPANSPQASVRVIGCVSQYNKVGVGVRVIATNPMPVDIESSDLRYNETYDVMNNGAAGADEKVTFAQTRVWTTNRVTKLEPGFTLV